MRESRRPPFFSGESPTSAKMSGTLFFVLPPAAAGGFEGYGSAGINGTYGRDETNGSYDNDGICESCGIDGDY